MKRLAILWLVFAMLACGVSIVLADEVDEENVDLETWDLEDCRRAEFTSTDVEYIAVFKVDNVVYVSARPDGASSFSAYKYIHTASGWSELTLVEWLSSDYDDVDIEIDGDIFYVSSSRDHFPYRALYAGTEETGLKEVDVEGGPHRLNHLSLAGDRLYYNVDNPDGVFYYTTSDSWPSTPVMDLARNKNYGIYVHHDLSYSINALDCYHPETICENEQEMFLFKPTQGGTPGIDWEIVGPLGLTTIANEYQFHPYVFEGRLFYIKNNQLWLCGQGFTPPQDDDDDDDSSNPDPGGDNDDDEWDATEEDNGGCCG